MGFQMLNMQRMVFSRFFGLSNGPLNYCGLLMWFFCTGYIVSFCKFQRGRDELFFNQQDQIEYWYQRYKLIFPPALMHQRLSAHYIEINQIFFVEMLKRYLVAKREILEERDNYSQEEQRTRYALNPNYIFEPLKNETPAIKVLRDGHYF